MTDAASAGPAEPGGERFVSARTRVAIAAAAGILASGVAAFFVPWEVAPILGWDVVAASFLGWFWFAVHGSDSLATARRAKADDPSRAVADLVLVAASVTSLLGVGLSLVKASNVVGLAQAMITCVAVLTVALSWLSVNVVFTLRYADLYYATGDGIDFHGDRAPPDYGDFAYVAFTIGMTYQVSDTDLVSRPIRRTALRHALLSYLFGIAIIATTINVVAGLLNH